MLLSFSSFAYGALSDNLIAYWDFSDYNSDYGTYNLQSGHSSLNASGCKNGGCIYFMQPTDYSNVSITDLENWQNVTFSYWAKEINLNVDSNEYPALFRADGDNYMTFKRPTDEGAFGIGTDYTMMKYRIGGGGAGDIQAEVGYQLPNTNWHHFVYTWDTNNDCKMAFDGVWVLNDTTCKGFDEKSSGDWQMILGNWVPGNIAYGWEGNLDEMALWNRTLSQTELDTLYNSGTGDFTFYTGGGGGSTPYVNGFQVVSITNLSIGQNSSGYFINLVDNTNTNHTVALSNTTDWTNIHIDYDGTNINVYQDNNMISSIAGSFGINLNNAILGKSTNGTYWKGYMDSVTIYENSLTTTERNSLYSNTNKYTPIRRSLLQQFAFENNNARNTSDDNNLVVGQYLQGGRFDGDGDYVNYTETTYDLSAGTTFSFWAKRNEIGATNYILGHSSVNSYRFLYFSATNGRVILESDTNSDTCSAIGMTADYNWHHYSISILNYNCSFYQDGILYTEDSSLVNNITLDRIGERGITLGNGFNGSIDEVMIFNRSLTAEQIAYLHNNQADKYYPENLKIYANDYLAYNNSGEFSGEANASLNISAPNTALENGEACCDFSFSSDDTAYLDVEILNVSYEYEIDETAPSSSATANNSDSSSYTFGVRTNFTSIDIALSCSDTGSGCDDTIYCLDTVNTCTPSTSYTAIFSVDTNGTSYIRYLSNDSVDNTETVNTQTIITNQGVALDESLPDVSISHSVNLSTDMNCTDLDGDTIYYYTNSTLFTIDSNGLMEDNPPQSEIGNYDITAICGDGHYNISDVFTYTITNAAPTFDENAANQSIHHNHNLTYDINCTDLDGDTIYYYINDSIAEINSSGHITDSPSGSEEGNYSILVTCGDGHYNTSDTFKYEIINDLPEITEYNFYPVPNDGTKNITFNFTATDGEGDIIYNWTKWYKNRIYNATWDNELKIGSNNFSYTDNLTISLLLGDDYKNGSYTNYSFSMSDSTEPIITDISVTPPVSVNNIGYLYANCTDLASSVQKVIFYMEDPAETIYAYEVTTPYDGSTYRKAVGDFNTIGTYYLRNVSCIDAAGNEALNSSLDLPISVVRGGTLDSGGGGGGGSIAECEEDEDCLKFGFNYYCISTKCVKLEREDVAFINLQERGLPEDIITKLIEESSRICNFDGNCELSEGENKNNCGAFSKIINRDTIIIEGDCKNDLTDFLPGNFIQVMGVMAAFSVVGIAVYNTRRKN